MWVGSPIDRKSIEELLEEAYRVHDVPLNEEAATQWGTENFPGGIPQSAVDECEAALEQKGRGLRGSGAGEVAGIIT